MKIILDKDGNPIFPPGTSDALKAEIHKALKDIENGDYEEINIEDLE